MSSREPLLVKKRPATASGVVFVTLEDETGNINVVVWRYLCNRQRTLLIGPKKIIAIERANDTRDMNDDISILREIIKGGIVLQITLNLPHV